MTHAGLFDGLDTRARADIAARVPRRRLSPGQILYRRGQAEQSFYLVIRGLVEVTGTTGGIEDVVRLQWPGEIVGEDGLLASETRPATVRAAVPTEVAELEADTFTEIVSRYPQVGLNLSRLLSRRARTRDLASRHDSPGELVALAVDPKLRQSEDLVHNVLNYARMASAQSVWLVRAPGDHEGTQTALAEAYARRVAHGTVILWVDAALGSATHLALRHVDRTVLLASPAQTTQLLHALARHTRQIDGVTVGKSPANHIALRQIGAIPHQTELAWLGRHMARTKIGLALGAGGAKGFAHVGALHALEEAGYRTDVIAGTSFGALVGACVAQGLTGSQTKTALRAAFTNERVRSMLTYSLSGASNGDAARHAAIRELVGTRTFEDLALPLRVVCTNVERQAPAVLDAGSLYGALIAATALPGLFPPATREGQRLTDGLGTSAVPVQAARADANITIAITPLNHDSLPMWPSEPQPPALTTSRPAPRLLQTVLDALDLAYLYASTTQAATADVAIAPRFGPSTWRDFHLAEEFISAGHRAAQAALPTLRTLAHPQF